MYSYCRIIPIICLLSTPAAALELTAKPRSLDDGDTYIIHFRSQAIDTPEKRQMCKRDGVCYRCGQEAKKALQALITDAPEPDGRPQNKMLRFKIWTVGRYGRPVVTAYDGTMDVHLELVKQGWAVVYRRYLPEPLRDAYIAAEADARAGKRGIWVGEFVEPSKWRRGERLEPRCGA